MRALDLPGRSVTLQIKSHPSNVALIGLAANAYCCHFFTNEFAEEVELAIVESLNNVIEHGYAGATNRPIKVCLEFHENAMVCKIRDYGEQWEMNKTVQTPELDVPLEDLPEGGFGLFLVQQTMDAVDLERRNPGSLLILKKFTHSPEKES